MEVLMPSQSETTTTGRKHSASEFLRLVATGSVRAAYDRYIAPNFRHHNAWFPGDAASLMKAMEENASQHPGKSIVIHHVLEDGNLVAIHACVHHEPGDRGIALVHIFRFEGDRIAELWDLGQPVPEHSPNENGMF
jgi:predicted SnoaL-like aldol condensation-catalyzing enzyme